MSGYQGRSRAAAKGGPNGVQRHYASELKEHQPLFNSYEHLQGLPRGDAALTMLRKVASQVKPLMRKRGWRVQILAEFLPPEQNLLGLNINHGSKICIRLRYHNHSDLFLPMEQVVDTMLHELSHNVWGEHDSNFHRLWDELRDEYETLRHKGYTGEGFLGAGRTLGGSRPGTLPPHELRRLARASAEKRKAQGALSQGSGQRLGGTPLHTYGGDVRQVIADQIERRNTINRGCASGRKDATALSDQSSNNTFKTKAEEDDANDRAIAQALFELMEEEEERKLQGALAKTPADGGLAWDPDKGLYDPAHDSLTPLSEEEQLKWAVKDSVRGEVFSGSQSSMSRFSPISPLDQVEASRTNEAPPVPLDSKPQDVSNDLPAASNGTFRARPMKDAGDMSEAKRARSNGYGTSTGFESSSASLPITHQAPPVEPTIDFSEPHNPDCWTCDICTCINPTQFLACDACGTERPQSVASAVNNRRLPPSAPRWTVSKAAQTESLGWNCQRCGTFMEHKWWTCSACGLMKNSS